MHSSLIAQELIAAYEATHYRVFDPCGAFVLQIGVPSSPLRALYDRHGVSSAGFITAWNPNSEQRTTDLNDCEQKKLQVDLQSHTRLVMFGLGEDPSNVWPGEPSFLALGLRMDDLEQLGRKYGQNGVVFAGDDAIPQLLLLR